MPSNLTVIQNEHQHPGSQTLLSSIDTHGHISYAIAASICTTEFANWLIDAIFTQPLRQNLDTSLQDAICGVAQELNLKGCDGIGFMARSINPAKLDMQSLRADVSEQAAGVHVASQEIATAMAEQCSACATRMGEQARHLVDAVKVFSA